MVGSRARKQRRQKRQQGLQDHHHQEDQLEESTTYSELLATTIPANSNQNADKVAQTLGIVQNGEQGPLNVEADTHFQTVSYSPASPIRDVEPEDADCENDGELTPLLRSKSCLNLVASILTTNHTHTRYRTLPRCPQTRNDPSYNQDGRSEQGGRRQQEWCVRIKP